MTPAITHSHVASAAESLRELIAGLQVDPGGPQPPEVQQALQLARRLQQQARELQTPQERRQQAELSRMMRSPHDKVTLIELTDQAFRCRAAPRTVDQLTHILDVQGVPRFFSPLDRALLKGFQSFGNYLPGVAVPLVKNKMHRETANVILPAERELLGAFLAARRREGLRMNVNYLGEALLGEREATRRLEGYLEALEWPEIEVISVKISTIYSQISPLARRHTLDVLCDRLETIFRAAAAARFTRADGSTTSKFVYLDMEEYRDMSITAEVLMRTLSRPGLEQAQAGIALQAYLPDSLLTQRELTAWSRQRVSAGGSPLTVRIVKGANLEMERVEASLHGWPLSPFRSKIETDANYKRMLAEALRGENRAALRVGIASHNLFDLAYGLVLAVEHDALDRVQVEMLEGMANHQRRALFAVTHDLLLYAPACRREQFISAIGYLVRRLDENTGPDNFLRHAFRLEVDSPEWSRLSAAFVEAFARIPQLSDQPRRTQNRRQRPEPPSPRPWQQFVNEPETDWSLPQNAQWAEEIIARWRPRCGDEAIDIPLVVAGETIGEGRQRRDCLDPSRPGVVVGRYRQATVEDVQRAVACAQADPDGWRGMTHDQRAAVLRGAAQQLRLSRGDLMGAALADGGKTLAESDPEVSEAVDFVEFYTSTAGYYHQLPGLSVRGRGVVVVVSPWNFPIAIPCGGVAAALAGGNTVILKPASDTVLVAYELCQCFWRSGVSRRVLQLLPCAGDDVAQQLVSHDAVDVVILTGGTATARAMLHRKPQMHLLAETGGKNATIVTALSDREQAVKNVIHSAFSHSGQKCSATSLLILEDEVYQDAAFRELLSDAVESLQVGSAWELQTRVGPLIRPPSGELAAALNQLGPNESWAVAPRQRDDNPNLISPAVRWGVAPGSVVHLTELFGPVLGVMRARNLEQAIALVNETGYGLTSGLESLDDREQQRWLEAIRAGNLYVNRPTTGAIVLRQPFGGQGKSAFGPGIKAGGPNYVAQLMRFSDSVAPQQRLDLANAELEELRDRLSDPNLAGSRLPPADQQRILAAIASYDQYYREEFGQQHDHFRLIGQDNLRRYLPVRELRVRIDPDDTPFQIVARVAAARTVGCRITVSLPPDFDSPPIDLLTELTVDWAGAIEFLEESEEELCDAIARHQTDRLRYACAARVPRAVREVAARIGLYISDAEVLAHGRVELLWYLREQSVSVNYHRYGNLGSRAGEPRCDVL